MASNKAAKRILKKFAENPKSRAAAMAAKCVDCVGGGDCTEWYQNIKHCSVTGCALHGFRPYK